MNNTSATSIQPALSLAARILLSALFLFSAYGKLMAPGATQGYIASVGLPAPALAYAVALAVELAGGAMLLLGYRTRIAAAALAAFSIGSALLFHIALGNQNELFHFLKNFAIAGGLLQVMATGAGSISLDGRRVSSSSPALSAR